MERERIVRLFVKTYTDDGGPQLLGVGGEKDGWSDDGVGAVEKHQDEHFAITPLVLSYMDSLQDIGADFDRRRAPAVLAAAERLAPVPAAFEGQVGEPGYGHIVAAGTGWRLVNFLTAPMESHSVMVASARTAVDAANTGSGEFLLVDAPLT